MIPVSKKDEPLSFSANVRMPGQNWQMEHPNGGRPPAYWRKCLPELRKVFANRCGYAAMIDPTGGTVDHYISCGSDSKLVYEWTNYRLAWGTINSSKQKEDDKVLDPFEVLEGWFEILIPSLLMVATDKIPDEYKAKA